MSFSVAQLHTLFTNSPLPHLEEYLTGYSPRKDEPPLLEKKELETMRETFFLEKRSRDIFSIAAGIHALVLCILIPLAFTVCAPLLFASSAVALGIIVTAACAIRHTKRMENLWETIEKDLSRFTVELNRDMGRKSLLSFALRLGDRERISILSTNTSTTSEQAPHIKAFLLGLLSKNEGAALPLLRFSDVPIPFLTIGAREGDNPTTEVHTKEEIARLLTYLDAREEAFTTLLLHKVAVDSIAEIPPCQNLYLKECSGLENLSPEFFFESSIRILTIDAKREEIPSALSFIAKIKEEISQRIDAPIRTNGCTITLCCVEDEAQVDSYAIRASSRHRLGRTGRTVIYVPELRPATPPSLYTTNFRGYYANRSGGAEGSMSNYTGDI